MNALRHINLFYIGLILLAIVLYFLLTRGKNEALSFYGFAESQETEINYNYSVVVDRILVQDGQSVQRGDTLMYLSRRKSREVLEDQQFKISELIADRAAWRQRKESEIAEMVQERESEIDEYKDKIERLNRELQFKESLTKDLKTISVEGSSYQPLKDEISTLEGERIRTIQSYDLKIENARNEIVFGADPYQAQISRLNAEQSFEQDQQLQHVVVTAPSNGLIGNVSCKEEEHIPSYRTLLTIYEPHSGIIKGYVHEDLTLAVNVGDLFRVSSLKDENIFYDGTVIGLGSRIVEIPSRLRKIPDRKSYGREVLVAITVENDFLQKEKVSISQLLASHN